MNRIEKGSLLVLAIIVAFNIFFGLGSIPLLDPDEPVYAETARETRPSASRRSRTAGRTWRGSRTAMSVWLVFWI